MLMERTDHPITLLSYDPEILCLLDPSERLYVTFPTPLERFLRRRFL